MPDEKSNLNCHAHVFSGLLVYFLYGIRHSLENRPLAASGHVISYSESQGQMGPFTGKESILAQQPHDELDDRQKKGSEQRLVQDLYQ